MKRRGFLALCAAALFGKAATMVAPSSRFTSWYRINGTGQLKHDGYFAISDRGDTFLVYGSEPIVVDGRPHLKLFARSKTTGRYRGEIAPVNG